MPPHLRRAAVFAALLLAVAAVAFLWLSPSSDQLGGARSEAPAAQSSTLPAPAVAARPARPPIPALSAATPEIGEFRVWAERYAGADADVRPAIIDEGVRLARAHRTALKTLIQKDPRTAIEQAVPMVLRQLLPAAVVGELEQRVSGEGPFDVLAISPDSAPSEPLVRRFVTVHGTEYRTWVYGERERQNSSPRIFVNGIAAEGQLALRDEPARALEIGEKPDPAKRAVTSCPVSGKSTPVEAAAVGEELPPITEETPAVEVGERIIYLCDGGHFRQLVEDLRGQERTAAEGATGGPGAATGSFPISGTTASTGVRKMLYMRVNFPDRLGEPQTEASAYSNIRTLTDYFLEQSYGRLSFLGTVTPLLTLPRTEQVYIDEYNTTGSNSPIMNDAKEAARAAGYPPEDFQHFTVIYFGGPGSFGGLGNVTGPNAWLKTTSVGTFEHEIGHNLGVWHSNFWDTGSKSVIGPGVNFEYGNTKDVMGNSSSAGHFNASMKEQLQWLKPEGYHTVLASGTFRLFQFDQASQDPARRYALKVAKDADRDYWLDFRQKFSTNPWWSSGVEVNWSPWGAGNGADNSTTQGSNLGTQLLDITPGTPDLLEDAALVIGRTFSDAAAGIHITPVGKGGTTPESIDVVVNVGTFAGNQPPSLTIGTSPTTIPVSGSVTFTASATDPDGDSLAYYWEFGDKLTSFSGFNFSTNNNPTQTKTYTTAGYYWVRCVASDMKGGSTAKSVLVTVGSPTTFTISGTVTDGLGAPVRDVRVSNGQSGSAMRWAFTDSDGAYTITNLGAGTVNVSALHGAYSFMPTATAVSVASNQSGVNFSASAGTYVSIEAPDATASEPSDTGTFRITRTGDTSAALTVYADFSGLAALTTDYTLNPAAGATPFPLENFTIPAGSASLDITVTPATDTTQEGPETIVMSLVNAGSYFPVGPQTATITLDDDDTARPRVELAVRTAETVENSGVPAEFVIRRTGSTASPLTLAYATLGGTGLATSGTDYNALGTLTIPANASELVVQVVPVNDALPEGLELVTLNLISSTNYVTSATAHTVKIVDDDVNVVTLSVPDNTANENGDTGTFTFTRTGDATAPLIVHYGIGGSSMHGVDFQALPGFVTFAAGSTTATVSVIPINDSHGEPAQTVTLQLRSGVNYQVAGSGNGTVTIGDDGDLPVVTVGPGGSGIVTEGTGSGSFLFTTTGTGTGNITVRYAVTGSATSGTDFTALSTTVSMGKNNTANVSVAPVNDTTAENSEFVTVTILPDPAYTVDLQNSATIVIRDNDVTNMVNVSRNSAAVSETVAGKFFFSRTGSTAAALTVNYTVGGTASPAADYAALSGSVTIPAASLGAYVDLIPINDTDSEGAETVTVTITPDAAYGVEVASATATIADNDTTFSGSLGFTTTSVLKQESDGASAIGITRSGSTTGAASVDYGVLAGTALGNGVDYICPAGRLDFAAGETTKTIPITVVDDIISEDLETVTIQLRNATGAALTNGSSQFTCLIADNEPRVTITASDAIAYEGGKGAQFTFRRHGRTSGALLVPITVAGTATSGSDFTDLPATVSIPDGAATATLTLTALADSSAEGIETVIVSLAASSNAVAGAQTSATASIDDAQSDDAPFIQFISPTVSAPVLPGGVGLSIDTSVSDDGPAASLTTTWQMMSGAGTATFSSPSQPDTDVTFSANGVYVLRLSASDGALTSTSNLTVVVGGAVLPWTSTDIGSVTFPGSGSEQNGVHALNGSGASLLGTADSFFFRSRRLAGDGEIIARVRYVPNTSNSARVGVMLRETTAANSRFDAMLLGPAFNNASSHNTRFSAGGTAGASTFGGVTPAWWVRVIRSGNNFSAYDSPDGATWTQRGSATTMAMANDIFAGLAVMSANGSRLNTALIDNVRIVGAPENTAPGLSIAAPASLPANSTLTLDGTLTDDALPSLNGATAVQWTQRSGPGAASFANAAAIDTTANLPVPGAYVLRLAADDGEMRTFAETSVTAAADTAPPTVTIAPAGTLTNASPINFTLAFNESVTGLTASGITVTNGMKGTVSGSGNVYSIAVTPTAQGAVTCALNAGAVQDAAGNPNAASSVASVTYDSVAPTISIGAPSVAATRSGPVTFTVLYSDTNFSSSTLAAGNVTLNKTGTANGTIGISGTGATRIVTISSITGDGTLGISLGAGTATDLAGNSAVAAGPSATFAVDNTGPVLTRVSITSNNASSGFAKAGDVITVSFDSNEPMQAPTATIAFRNATVSGSGTAWSASITVTADLFQVPAALSITPRDVHGNTSAAVASVTDGTSVRVDTIAPALTVPSAQIAEATSASGANVTYPAATATDANTTMINYSRANGSLFALGVTAVNVTATDAAGNTSTNSFNVTVRDSTAPAVTGPADRIVEATGPNGAAVTFTPTATDAVGVTSITASPTSGSTFPLGLTTVQVTAKDAANNTGTGTFKITVRDTTAPVVSAPPGGFSPLTVATGLGGTAALPDFAAQALASDLVGIDGAVTQSPASGSPQPVGPVQVLLTARDAAGNAGTLQLNVQVTDGTAPVLAGPLGGFTSTNIATGQSGTGVLPDFVAQASATDNVAVVGAISQDPVPGGAYPVGTVEVTLRAADAAGNIGRLTVAVNMNDGTLPVITATPQDRTIKAGPQGTGVAPDLLPEVTATDNVAVTGMVQSPAPGAVLPLGPNDITITVSDAAGNSAKAIVHVTVTDVTQPVVTAPEGGFTPVSITTAAGGLAMLADYAAQATASDNVGVVGGVVQTPAAGTTHAVGSVPVTLSATDAAGNVGALQFTVAVLDGTPPVLTVPADVVVEASSAAGATVTFPAATATDEVTASPHVAYSRQSGATFPLGKTIVTVTATDDANNSAQSTFSVTVRDTTAPVIAPIADVTIEATSSSGAVHVFTPSATDAVTAAPEISYTPALPAADRYPIGATPITVHARDAAGNESTLTLTITVRDTVAPVVGGAFGPLVISAGPLPDYRGDATFEEAVGVVSTTQQPAPGSVVAFGTVQVTVTANDAAGNSGATSFAVQVRPLAPLHQPLLARGEAPPGAGSPDGPPDDATLTGFGSPAIDAQGRVAVVVQWSSPTKGKGSGLTAGGQMVFQSGETLAEVSGATLKSFLDPVMDEGRIATIATLAGVPKSAGTAILTDALSGTPALLARTGVATAAASGASFKSFSSVAVADGAVAFLGQLKAGTGTPAVSTATDVGIWAATAGQPLKALLREGQLVNGRAIKTLVSFSVGNGSPGQGRGALLWRNGALTVQALAILSDNSQAIVSAGFDSAAPEVISISGAEGAGTLTLADAYFKSYGFPARTAAGDAAFLATIAGPVPGLTAANARCIFELNESAKFAPIARVGEPATGSGGVFSVLKDPVLASDGGLAFTASVSGRGVSRLASSTVWWRPAGGSLRLLAQGGAEPADVPGAQWSAFTSLAIAAGDGPLFTASLVPGKGGVTASRATGLWAVDHTGALRLLFRAGDTIGSRTLKSFTVLSATAGATGSTRSFNDSGRVAWKATFTDGSTAILTTVVP